MNSRRRTTMAAATELGEITFDDWYSNPVFDQDPDERLEVLAMSSRAPLRMAAGAWLRVAPDRRTRPAATSWRQRGAQVLDRWAEREAAWQQRLEDLVLPRRWRM
jgi:hypothetical protein